MDARNVIFACIVTEMAFACGDNLHSQNNGYYSSTGSISSRTSTVSPRLTLATPPATTTPPEGGVSPTLPGSAVVVRPSVVDCVHECAAQLLFTCIRWCKSVPAFSSLAYSDQVGGCWN